MRGAQDGEDGERAGQHVAPEVRNKEGVADQQQGLARKTVNHETGKGSEQQRHDGVGREDQPGGGSGDGELVGQIHRQDGEKHVECEKHHEVGAAGSEKAAGPEFLFLHGRYRVLSFGKDRE